MMGHETAIFLGRLAQDPIERTTPAGNYVCNFTLVRNKPGKDGKETPVFRKVEAWQKLGESCMRYLRKGDPVYVEGEPKLSQWTSKDNEARAEIVIEAKVVRFLGSKQDAA